MVPSSFMISISAPVFDLDGNLLIARVSNSDLDSGSRRVTRTATLDGGVSLADMGYAHGDRTLRIVAEKATREMVDQAAYLQRNYPLLLVATTEGVFLGAIESLAVRGGDLSLNYLVKEKLTEE
jgi:hypothetical protein